jgi:hypothetical protein
MKNIFEETYNKVQELNRIYHSEEGKDEKVQEGLRAEYQKAMNRIAAKAGENKQTYKQIWRAYEKSRDNENEILNFDDVIWDRDVEALAACMKENGIREFTYSCRATDAIETLWLFKEAGCEIGEMIEVNLRKGFMGKGYEKAHAFKMSIR